MNYIYVVMNDVQVISIGRAKKIRRCVKTALPFLVCSAYYLSMTQPDLHTVALSILRSPGWSRVGITAPSSRLRQAAASEMAEKIIEALEHPERNQDHRQIALPF